MCVNNLPRVALDSGEDRGPIYKRSKDDLRIIFRAIEQVEPISWDQPLALWPT